MREIYYTPKSEVENRGHCVCKGCKYLRGFDADTDEDGDMVMMDCTIRNLPVEVLESVCECHKNLMNAQEDMAWADRQVMEQEGDGDDGQPDEAKEWEDFGEVYSDDYCEEF